MRDSESNSFNWEAFENKRKQNDTAAVDRTDISNNQRVSAVTPAVESDNSNHRDCEVPFHQNGYITINNFIMAIGKNIPHDIVVEVTCSQGFYMDLNRPRDNRIKCKDGNWNKKFPLCEGLLELH